MKNGVLWNSISKQINDWLKLRRESRIRFSYFHRKMHTIGMVDKAYCHWLGYASTAFSSTLVKQYPTKFQSGSQPALLFRVFKSGSQASFLSWFLMSLNAQMLFWLALEPSILLYYEKTMRKLCANFLYRFLTALQKMHFSFSIKPHSIHFVIPEVNLIAFPTWYFLISELKIISVESK